MFLCVFSALNLRAQRDLGLERELVSKEDWKTGTVQLNSQTIINCQLKYNRFNGILTFKTTNEIRNVSAQQILRFSIEEDSVVRNFISSPKVKVANRNPTRFFFEVLMECEKFKLIGQESTSASSRPVLKNAPRLNGGSYSYYLGDAKMLTFEESLYFFDSTGNIKHYMTMTSSYSMVKSKERKYIADKKLMSYYLGDRYTEMKTYAKKNKLSFRDRNDLVAILTYFKKSESL